MLVAIKSIEADDGVVHPIPPGRMIHGMLAWQIDDTVLFLSLNDWISFS